MMKSLNLYLLMLLIFFCENSWSVAQNKCATVLEDKAEQSSAFVIPNVNQNLLSPELRGQIKAAFEENDSGNPAGLNRLITSGYAEECLQVIGEKLSSMKSFYYGSITSEFSSLIKIAQYRNVDDYLQYILEKTVEVRGTNAADYLIRWELSIYDLKAKNRSFVKIDPIAIYKLLNNYSGDIGYVKPLIYYQNKFDMTLFPDLHHIVRQYLLRVGYIELQTGKLTPEQLQQVFYLTEKAPSRMASKYKYSLSTANFFEKYFQEIDSIKAFADFLGWYVKEPSTQVQSDRMKIATFIFEKFGADGAQKMARTLFWQNRYIRSALIKAAIAMRNNEITGFNVPIWQSIKDAKVDVKVAKANYLLGGSLELNKNVIASLEATINRLKDRGIIKENRMSVLIMKLFSIEDKILRGEVLTKYMNMNENDQNDFVRELWRVSEEYELIRFIKEVLEI